MRERLSAPLLIFASSAFAAGLATGLVAWPARSDTPERHRAGTAAWGPHLGLALFAALLLAGVVLRHRRADRRTLILLAPLGRRAARRVRRTVGQISRPTVALRCLVGLLPATMLVYLVFRMGAQVTGGLDPNFTLNAWGGPTYLGAMACHALDAALIMAFCGWLLHLLLLPDPARSRGGAGTARRR